MNALTNARSEFHAAANGFASDPTPQRWTQLKVARERYAELLNAERMTTRDAALDTDAVFCGA